MISTEGNSSKKTISLLVYFAALDLGYLLVPRRCGTDEITPMRRYFLFIGGLFRLSRIASGWHVFRKQSMYKGAQIAKCQRTGHPVSVRSDLSVSFLVPLCQLDFRVYASDGTVLWRRSFLRVEGGLALPWGNQGGTGEGLICAISLCSHRVNHAVSGCPSFTPKVQRNARELARSA